MIVSQNKSKPKIVYMATALFFSVCPAHAQQNNLGTSFGIPNSSPGVCWPQGGSIESLGFGRLYPNGPEFGLSNTSGGFGVAGSGRLSGVGLAERSVPTFVQVEMERPYVQINRLTDAFNRERTASAGLLSTVIGDKFRAEIQRGSLNESWQSTSSSHLIPSYVIPSVDSVLNDQSQSTDTVLRTGL
jgi:hypothetical protein